MPDSSENLVRGNASTRYAYRATSSASLSESSVGVRHQQRLKRTIIITGFTVMLLIAAAVILSIYFITPAPELVAPTEYCTGPTCLNFNHSLWTRTLQKFMVENVEQNGIVFNAVDYPGLMADPDDLKAYISSLAKVDVNLLTEDNYKALLVNAYNAFAIDMVVAHPCAGGVPCSSVKDVTVPFGVSSVWTWRIFNIGGAECALDDIEQSVVRPVFKDPRMHAALNCASISCPDLMPAAFEASTLSSQLNDHVQRWLSNPAKGLNVTTVGGSSPSAIELSLIFSWYSEDFKNYYNGGLAAFLTNFGPPEVADFVSVFGTDVDAWGNSLSFFEYDWNLATIPRSM